MQTKRTAVERTVGRRGGQTDEADGTDRPFDVLTDRRSHGQMVRRTQAQLDRSTDWRTDRRTDKRTDRRTEIQEDVTDQAMWTCHI